MLHIESWMPCSIGVDPDGPQVKILNIPWLQKERAQVRMSVRGQSLAFIQDVSRGLFSRLTPTSQKSVGQP